MEYSAGCFCIKCSMTQCFTLINTDNCNLEDYWPLSLFFFFFLINQFQLRRMQFQCLSRPEELEGEGGKSYGSNANILTNCK